MLSVIIPSYKDPYLHKTIDSLLDNAQGELEIVVVLDGYWPEKEIRNDKRIKIVHLGKNRGMRGAINAGVLASTGEFIMRTDEHCMFGPGYDIILTKDLKENWIVNPRRYFLDPEKWEIMDIPPTDYGDLKIQGTGSGRKFHGQENKELAEQRKNIMIDETFAMQGSCWIMRRSWWDKVIGELQTEGYGPLYQDSHEMVFKTWKAGGKLMVNKNTWHAHKHRSFNRTHSNGTKENPSNNEACFAYSLSVWEDYYNELKQNGRFDYTVLDKQ
jgi:glycosyltransferase involved in cell wall biosynthesis